MANDLAQAFAHLRALIVSLDADRVRDDEELSDSTGRLTAGDLRALQGFMDEFRNEHGQPAPVTEDDLRARLSYRFRETPAAFGVRSSAGSFGGRRVILEFVGATVSVDTDSEADTSAAAWDVVRRLDASRKEGTRGA